MPNPLHFNRTILRVRIAGRFGIALLWQYVPGQTPFGVFGERGYRMLHVGPYRVELLTGAEVGNA